MARHSNNQMVSTKPGLSGLKNQKLISAVFEGKCPSDYESAWSPTSPLDFRMFSSLGNPFTGSSSRSMKGQQKSWDSGKVGLNIVHSLDDYRTDSSPDCKNIVFGSLMRSGNHKCQKPHHPNPMVDDFHLLSQPFAKTFMHNKDMPNIVFEIGHDVVELRSSGSVDAYYCSGTGNISVNDNDCQAIKQAQGSLSGHIRSDIEISEDYTCVVSHGLNPKTTHIYGDQVLDSVEHNGLKKRCCKDKKESIFVIAPLDLITPIDVLPSNDFLSFCWLCSKKLGMGKDTYMYRGYKAFCSCECRSEVIDRDEEMEVEEEDEAAAKSGLSSENDLSMKKSNGVIHRGPTPVH